jgi:glutamate-1-semialdehyde 2,1-aminomutase
VFVVCVCVVYVCVHVCVWSFLCLFSLQHVNQDRSLFCTVQFLLQLTRLRYGFSSRVGELMRQKALPRDTCDTGGVGGTLAANVLSMATMRATLEHILTPKNYARNIPLAIKFQEDVERVMAELKLPWIIKRLGCRVEYWMRPTAPVNGTEAVQAIDTDLDRFMHIYALNRGILMTPFHNMALIAPDTTVEDIDYHTLIFRNSVLELLGHKPEPIPSKKSSKL